jgi:hypothetical protein
MTISVFYSKYLRGVRFWQVKGKGKGRPITGHEGTEGE